MDNTYLITLTAPDGRVAMNDVTLEELALPFLPVIIMDLLITLGDGALVTGKAIIDG